jgi:DinB superfamily
MKQESTDTDASLRKHLLKLLKGGQAHTDFETAVAKLPPEHRGSKPPGAPHSPWELLEHLRISQWDILEFSRNPGHVSPKWPDDYWPKEDTPSEDGSWERSLDEFRSDLEAFESLLEDPATDLFAPIVGGEGQTVLREALLIADHNAYHLGQLVLVRRLLKAW